MASEDKMRAVLASASSDRLLCQHAARVLRERELLALCWRVMPMARFARFGGEGF